VAVPARRESDAKRSGMRWDAYNADALMALANLEQSDQWKLYWQTRLKLTG